MRPLIPTLLILSCVLLGAVATSGLATSAQETTVERSVDTPAPDPGETVTVTTSVELDSETEVNFADRFDPGFASAKLVSVELDDEAQSTVFESTNGEGILALVDAGPGELVFTYEVRIPQAAEVGDKYAFNGSIEIDGEPVSIGGVSTLTVGQTGTSAFDLSLDPIASVTAGDEITVEYTVENTGDVEGTQEIGFSVANSDTDSETVTLGAGESTTGRFSYVTTTEDSPEVSVAVASDDDTVTATVTVDEPSDGNGSGSDDGTGGDDGGNDGTGGGDGLGPGFGVVIAGLAAVLLAGYTLLRRDDV